MIDRRHFLSLFAVRFEDVARQAGLTEPTIYGNLLGIGSDG